MAPLSLARTRGMPRSPQHRRVGATTAAIRRSSRSSMLRYPQSCAAIRRHALLEEAALRLVGFLERSMQSLILEPEGLDGVVVLELALELRATRERG